MLEGKRRFVADYCLDVHGDEGHPYNYVVCCPAWTERLNSLQDMFWSEWRASCPDFSPASSDKVMELGAVETPFFVPFWAAFSLISKERSFAKTGSGQRKR